MSPNCFETATSKTTARTHIDMTSSSSATQSSTTISSSPSSSSSVPLVPSAPLDAHHTGGHVTCVVIGDCGVGKSSLVVSYTTNDFPTQYVPTAFDNYSVDVSVGTRVVHFDICDTGGKVKNIWITRQASLLVVITLGLDDATRRSMMDGW